MPHPDSTAFLESGLFLDLEVNPASGVITQVGARLGEMHWKAAGARVRHALADIGEAAAQAAFLAGHNLLDHDLRVLESALPESPLLKLPAVDTLVLSTLAFPKKPFHALTKDYKQSETDRNNPLFDADRAHTLLADSITELRRRITADPGLLTCYAAALTADNFAESPACAGFRLLFAQIGVSAPTPTLWQKLLGRESSPDSDITAWQTLLGQHACTSAPAQIAKRLRAATSPDIDLAFAAAWVAVRGDTFPAWAGRRFRGMASLLRAWRATPCADPGCAYCARTHAPTRLLSEVFGYPDFRPLPEVQGRPGVSLQRELVTRGLRDESLLGILPTGGGKSLCFQIPAIHRHQATGALTVVISPLQSLMKDQVDNLDHRFGYKNARALYGGLNPVDRKLLLNDVADGSVGLLYLSPEQLRNTPVKQLLKLRHIGAWVFDEAHCLTKWGHDFRPDYFAASKAIREIAEARGDPIPPIQCYTATAKADVRADILAHFKSALGRELTLLDGGAERTNLAYRVENLPAANKTTRIRELLTETLAPGRPGSAVIFCASRNNTMAVAAELSAKGFPCKHFHAGLDREDKERIQSDFMAGEIRVIAATNAFGMGVDKDDIRLVIHLDMPGSLENYLQEAGRAGRDGKPAEAVLLFDEKTDAERQFDLLDLAKLDARDITGILKTVRKRAQKAGAAVLTATELAESLLPVGATTSFESLDETAVKAAVAHLERCEFLIRDDNVNRVFQVTPLVPDLSRAAPIIDRQPLDDPRKALWRAIMRTILDPDLRSPAEYLAALQTLADFEPVFTSARAASPGKPINETRIIIGVLTEMSAPGIGLLQRDLLFSAVVPLGKKSPKPTWRRTIDLELRLLAKLAELHPDLDDRPVPVAAAPLAAAISAEATHPCTADFVIHSLHRWADDWRRLRPGDGLLTVKSQGRQGTFRADPRITWSGLRDIIALRHHAGTLLADELLRLAKAARSAAPAKITQPGLPERDDGLTEFKESDLTALLAVDLVVAAQKLPPRLLQTLLFHTLSTMDKVHAIALINGKSIITSAMTLRLHPAARARYTKGDHEALEVHHAERLLQVHVLAAYAKRFASDAAEALRMMTEYFVLLKATFIERYFGDNPDQLTLACTLESFQQITRGLSPTQHSLVCSHDSRNLMVLAGPGSGKTRVIVHRIAYLVKVSRVNPARIAVMCYNRHAALELRRRLRALIGPRAAALVVGTYHGLALRLTGKRAELHRRETAADTPDRSAFDQLLHDATALLTGAATPAGEDDEAFLDRLRAGFTHLFVDEYQDISPAAYAFVAALAGKDRPAREGEERPQLTAVGDDDQAINGFAGADVKFIRQFEQDYAAKRAELVENFRSTSPIITAANAWIADCPGRLKSQHIRLDSTRAESPIFESDRFATRPVRRITVHSASTASRFATARAALGAVERIREADTRFDWSGVALITRDHESLAPLRQVLTEAGIPHRLAAEANRCRLDRERTAYELLSALREETRDTVPLHEVYHRLDGAPAEPAALLRALLAEFADTLPADTSDISPAALADHLRDALWEMKSGMRPGDGILLSTAHAAKGLEFDHVLVLDGRRWGGSDEPEERRLLYVAMTRAKRSLSLVMTEARPGPLFHRLAALGIGESTPVAIRLPDPHPALRFITLSLEDYFIDFLGRKSPNDRAHRALAALQPGAALTLRETPEGFLHLVTPERAPVAVAALSKSGRERLARALAANRLRSVTLISCYTRLASDAENPDRLACERWEIPLVEIVVAEDA